jgi:hypothetical protein
VGLGAVAWYIAVPYARTKLTNIEPHKKADKAQHSDIVYYGHLRGLIVLGKLGRY